MKIEEKFVIFRQIVSCILIQLFFKVFISCIMNKQKYSYLFPFFKPFWPTGSGCARGFLGAFDAAWMIRNWAMGKSPPQVLAERESVFTVLSQTTPSYLHKNFNQYSIDPNTRLVLYVSQDHCVFFLYSLALLYCYPYNHPWLDCLISKSPPTLMG